MGALDTARLTALKAALTDSKQALAAQGVSVPDGTLLNGIPALIASIARIRAERGSCTLPADSETITIPFSSDAKLLILAPDADTQTALAQAAATYTYGCIAVSDNGQGDRSAVNVLTYHRMAAGSYSNAINSAQFADGLSLTVNPQRPVMAGTYIWTAYCWEVV